MYEIRISDTKFNDTCDCYAHKVNGVEKDFIYVGVYLAYEENGKLRSVSGVTPTEYKPTDIERIRTLAQANGNGYQCYNWYTHLLLQIMYVITFKNLNSQDVIGLGCKIKKNTGELNNRDFAYGNPINNEIVMNF